MDTLTDSPGSGSGRSDKPRENPTADHDEKEPTEFERLAPIRAARNRDKAPVIAELREAGYEVEGIWELSEWEDSDSYLRILLKHLHKDAYLDFTRDSMARRLGTNQALAYWDDIVALYRSATGELERDGLAASIANIATRHQVEDLIALVEEESQGDSRILLLRKLWRIGGDRGRALVRSLLDDPQLGIEATEIVKRAEKRQSKN